MTHLEKADGLHQVAMDFAERAVVAEHQGRKGEARELYRKALTQEQAAAELLRSDVESEPSRSVLYRSAATLALKSRDFKQAKSLAEDGLGGNPPVEIESELLDLLGEIEASRPHVAKGTHRAVAYSWQVREPVDERLAAVLPPLFAALPEPFAAAYDPAAPWALLGDTLDAILAALPSSQIDIRLSPDVHILGDGIVIGAGTHIHPGAVIEGPVWIGRDVEIRPGAYLRGGIWIGDGCVVGASTELKRAILFPGAKAPHLNYVGDSILGAGVNLGAGTILSNFRHDGGEVRIGRRGTGRRKLSAVLGDGVMTGCNCVVHPGVVVGRGTQIYPGVQLRSGIYPEKSIIKLRQELDIVPQE